MAKTVDLRRHTDNDGDVLTAQGVGAAVEIGRGLAGDYHLAVSTGAQRATQALACMLAGHGRGVPGGVVVEPGLRSGAEDRWRAIAGKASGGGLASFRAVDAEFVDEEARLLGLALRRVFDSLDDGEVALVVGHSPTNEAAVLGLTGRIIDPLGKGEGVRVVSDGGFTISPLSDAPHTLNGPIVKSRFSSVHDHDSADPAYAADLKVALDTIVDDMQIPGAVVLIRSESKGDWSGTTGTRRLGTDEPVTIDDHFRVGSNTKTMTGTVVLQLVEEGDIDLDDPVSQYRPEVPNGDNITLAMLLEMRSGLSNFSADEGFNARLDNEPSHAWDPSELLAVAFAHEPSFDPGADFEYSNTNTVLLGLIIEQRTNLSLKEAFQQRIFDRLDLDHTLLPAPDDA
ncbi:MAG: D-alanyl-D-alanine carboxypeptidase, partial [Chloroflexota bacterium]|nr:D-alanyl-D-alanine carboxypeptidase [Chloroflexota bacterium]